MTSNIPSQDRLRHRCRNIRCHMKLAAPTDSRRRAFCCEHCCEIFYLNRCRVCEATLPPGPSNRVVCRRSECRAELRKFPQTYQWSKSVERPPRSADKTGLKIGSESGRGWRIVAGPALTATAFQLATIPIDPELAARLDRAHAGYVENRKKAKRAAARRASIKRKTRPVEIIGRRQVPAEPKIDLSTPTPTAWAIPSRWTPTGADADVPPTGADADVPPIPDFLNRLPVTSTRPVTDEGGADLAPETGPELQRVA